jgi:tetratricopeptide (TPR) repeat protein
MNAPRSVLGVLSIILLGLVGARAQSTQLSTSVAPGSRVLVMPFVLKADPPGSSSAAGAAWIGEAAAMLIGDELDARGLTTVARDERVEAFDRLQLPLLSPLTRATTIRVGELLGASDIIVGEIQAGPRLAVRARLIRLATGEQLADVQDEGDPAKLTPLFERVAGTLARASGRPLPSEPNRRPDLPPDVLENYIKGLMSVAPATRQRFLEAAYHGARRDGRVLLALWHVYTDQAQYAKALASAKSVGPDSPDARQARFLAALSLIDLNRLDEAFTALGELQAEQAAPALSSALGIVQLRRGSAVPLSAAAYFTRAVEGAPENTDYLFNLGYAYALAHDAAPALVWLREAVRVDATDADAHFVMSAVLAGSGRTVEAQRELDLAKLLGTERALAPGAPRDKVPARWERVPSAIDTTSGDRAASIRNPGQREQQEIATFHLEAARRLIAAQKEREAVDELRRAVYLSPYQDEPHLLLGRAYERSGRISDAIDEFKVALWCRESADAHAALAGALLASGDRTGARREAERAIALRPDVPNARAILEKTR